MELLQHLDRQAHVAGGQEVVRPSRLPRLLGIARDRGGLEQTSTMVEPNWFYTMKDNGIAALNYDLGPNFMFAAP